MIDANKTGETRRVTEAAAIWMGSHGFKPVETEVPVSDGWLADIAGCATFTRSEAIQMGLIRRKPAWDRQWQHQIALWENEFASIPQIITAAIEVKTSRSDFTRDRKWFAESPVHLLYIASQPGLVSQEELPDNIGLLSCGDGVPRCVRKAKLSSVAQRQVLAVVFQIAMRRDHFTAYARWREFERQARSRDNERTNVCRVNNVVNAVLSIVDGHCTAEDAMRSHGINAGKQNDKIVRELRRVEQRFATALNEEPQQ